VSILWELFELYIKFLILLCVVTVRFFIWFIKVLVIATAALITLTAAGYTSYRRSRQRPTAP
jgi:hypothetical protein